MEDNVTWLVSMALALVSVVGVIALGCYLIRKVVEDFSNSTALAAFRVRLFRLAPGGTITAFGCILLARLVNKIIAVPFTHP